MKKKQRTTKRKQLVKPKDRKVVYWGKHNELTLSNGMTIKKYMKFELLYDLSKRDDITTPERKFLERIIRSRRTGKKHRDKENSDTEELESLYEQLCKDVADLYYKIFQLNNEYRQLEIQRDSLLIEVNLNNLYTL